MFVMDNLYTVVAADVDGGVEGVGKEQGFVDGVADFSSAPAASAAVSFAASAAFELVVAAAVVVVDAAVSADACGNCPDSSY